DPQLMFVMGGALGTYALLYRVVRAKAPRPLLDDAYHVPSGRQLDARLIGGAAVFGVGWGLMGLCPGPALVSAGAGNLEALAFVAAMAVAMVIVNLRARAHGDG
ncbi:MAG: DUF6691 family protein, partial [Polyangiales bacterium]